MKKTITLLSLLTLMAILPVYSQTKITVDGLEREYLKFTPSSNSTEPSSLMILLHYLGATASEFAELCNAQAIADCYNIVILVPQALDEQDETVKNAIDMAMKFAGFTSLSTKAVWGAGASIKTSDVVPAEYDAIFNLYFPTLASAGKVEFNKDIDDVKFIDDIINQAKINHNIDETKIYVVGGSMGGAMTYKYAYSQTSQATAIEIGRAHV